MLEKDEVKKELSKFARKVIAEAKRNFKKKNASGKGIRSLRSNLEVSKRGSFTLEFFMEKYMDFQDKGVSGVENKYDTPYSYKKHPTPYKKGAGVVPPSSAFANWTVRRGIAPRDEKGRFLPRKSLQRAIAISVYKKGIKPSLFFTNAFNKAFKTLPEELEKAYALDVERFIKITLKTNDIKP